jgi:hypothetical protein
LEFAPYHLELGSKAGFKRRSQLPEETQHLQQVFVSIQMAIRANDISRRSSVSVIHRVWRQITSFDE